MKHAGMLYKIVVVVGPVFASRAAFDAGAPAVAVVLASFGGYFAGFWDGAKSSADDSLRKG